MIDNSIGIYIHIPFCRSRCHYCDFNTYSGREHLIPDYTSALIKEIKSWKPCSLLARSIYFGGGTPSLLPAENIQAILAACHASLNVIEGVEITLEANPGGSFINRFEAPFTKILPLSPLKEIGGRGERLLNNLQYLNQVGKLGVNRLSLGTQSFDDSLLKVLGRLHDSAGAKETYFEARKAGFDNINLDLIYGIPAQTLDQWQNSLQQALKLQPGHLSLYSLTLEEGTPLYLDIGSGKISAPDADMAADMYLLAEKMLEEAGYIHYEISNWTWPGRESVHNLNYWHNGQYIGIGAGAHSYFNKERFWNVSSPQQYIRMIWEEGKAISGKEIISPEVERADYIILGLRLVGGLDLQEFKVLYGNDMTELYGETISSLKSAGLLERTNSKLCLTPKGRLLGNEVFQKFLVS